ncbi:MAG: ribose 5-phosphate isomerase B [Sphingomonadales bacterium]
MSDDAIAIASDHAGFELKEALRVFLTEKGHTVLDLGTQGADSVDYPDFGAAVAKALGEGRASRGVLVCGTGIGISMAANRFPHVRAALCHNGLTARLSRQHNDANVLALGSRIIGIETAKDCLREFLNTEFEGGRHAKRIKKFS